jgi:hypothetical protein
MKPTWFPRWIRDSEKSIFDWFVVVSPHPITNADLRKANALLCANDPESIVVDDAMAFVVFLDPKLNTPSVRLEIKYLSLQRVFLKQQARQQATVSFS